MRARRRLASDCSGAIAAEFVLILPALLLLVLGTIETARYMWIRTSLQSAVEDAVRCDVIGANCTDANTPAYAASIAMGVPISSSSFQVSSVTSPSCGKTVSVVGYTFQPVVPFIPLSIPINASATRPMPAGSSC